MASPGSSSASTVVLLLVAGLCFLIADGADEPKLPAGHLPPLPDLPKPDLPDLPKPSKPDLPDLPNLPKPDLPGLPNLPKPDLPGLPKLPQPQIPGLPNGPLPKLPNGLPGLPSLPNGNLPGCTQVFIDIRECVTFVLKPSLPKLGAAPPAIPAACFNAFTTLIGASLVTKDNRVATCKCVKAVATILSRALPGGAIPMAGFPLPPTIDCAKIL